MQAARNMINSQIPYMFDVLGKVPIWPQRDIIMRNMQESNKADYSSTFMILELKIENPMSLVLQS